MKRQLTPPPTNPIKKKRTRFERSELDKEIDQDLFLEITTKAEPMLPVNINKYLGSVQSRGNRWKVIFGPKYQGSTHYTEEEAKEHIRKVNIQQGWPIKNIVYKYNEEYYCALTRNQFMKFSIEDRPLIEQYVIFSHYDNSSGTFYAYCKKQGVNIAFHRLVLENHDRSKSIDHISRLTLDNSRPNLRIVSPQTQAINRRSIFANNKTGFSGVYRKNRWTYAATWVDEQGSRKVKEFYVRKLGTENAFLHAINFRKQKIESLDHYKVAMSM